MADVLITGASGGLGRALAYDLAEAGHRLILHGRNPDRLTDVAQRTGGEPIRADLSSLAEIRALADAVRERRDRLDVLVNNAGVGFGASGGGREVSKDGYELRFAGGTSTGSVSPAHAGRPTIRPSGPGCAK